jgi:hypothetical protein
MLAGRSSDCANSNLEGKARNTMKLRSASRRILLTGVALAACYQLAIAQTQDKLAPFVGTTLSGAPCAGGRSEGVGPWDYLDRGDPFIAERLSKVEGAHFKPEVEKLQHFNTIGNLNYTLRAFPNNYRALMSISRLDLKTGQYGNMDKFIPAE